ncbi:beta-N-acetylhexosaminidase [Actinoplanes sp. SE50]|uniref:beta-N-acetylhexosaminidase n=1 Tax=unclassified Actinoplanes TaxID=2626549 RepID=UPI00023EBC33|nr:MULTISPECIES: beta-N-acetylhexosaminidase [unclassified Actinoplanes]AEV87390.1 beta-hexosaminidase [Actinoplanes sp. SE50/110]ATO85792.1 beta-N-acetylhexosaminidase [Actinoplanes sp. SE50]SLM03205.1 beta-N-acetylhexosaminidase [Actinoplanes sp. SE50/110]
MNEPLTSIVPRPARVTSGEGAFHLGPGTALDAGPALTGVAAWLRGALGRVIGGHLLPGPDGIRLRTVPELAPEAYQLEVRDTGIEIRGGSPAGVFYGAQTLRQMLPPVTLRRARLTDGPWTIPAGRVDDAPRFPWRGVMLDVARHFMPVADVLRLIDLIAFHKLNVLHLHLTDDQGWRLEVPGRPRLTSIGAWRPATMLGSRRHERFDARPHGGFYSDDDLREIVAYAADRHITVVPEVDMPGHMQAAIAAYPELGNGFSGDVRAGWGISPHVLNLGPEALDFCRTVLDHLCDLFPSELIGIGGDECPADEWHDSPVAQARIRAEGLGGPDRLQPWFTTRMAGHLATRGRRVFGWDEILAGGAPPGAVIAAWRGPGPAAHAARAGHPVVSCPDMSVYLDYRQSDDPGEPTPVGTRLTIEDVFAFDPVPPGLTPAETALVRGGQANLWTEHMESARRVDYQAFPRLCAFAEAVWGPAERDFTEFIRRLPAHLERLDALGVNYRPLSGPRPWDARPDAPGNPRTRNDRLAELREMTADLERERS